MNTTRKKLIEVALPLDVINEASVRESYIYRGNPSALHKWWAQRPLAAARAVIFAQMVDDPSANPDLFPTAKAQQKERARLFSIITKLVEWENNANETVLTSARDEIWQSWRRSCAENADHPRAAELFDRSRLPAFHDSFAGGGTLPLEAQRLGLESYASDLNPVAVLINKAMIEIPPRFAARRPVNPKVSDDADLFGREWKGAQGLAEDVRYYGTWIRDEAEKRIGGLYPTVEITKEMVSIRPDLKPFAGRSYKVIAWLWARTVKSPNPAFATVDVPLVSSFMVCTRSGKEAYVEPVINGDSYRFTVKTGKPKDPERIKSGTTAGKRGAFKCLMSGVPVTYDYIRGEGMAGRIGARLMTMVVEVDSDRMYLAPTPAQEEAARSANPEWKPDVEFFQQALGFRVGNYGMSRWSDLFTNRQLVALTTFSDLLGEAMSRVRRDAIAAGLPDEETPLRQGGAGATAYAEAVMVYLAFGVDKYSVYGNSLVPWYPKESRPSMLFGQQVVSMVWDFTEVNPFSEIGGSLARSLQIVAGALDGLLANGPGNAVQGDAASASGQPTDVVVSTDPPYYDNVGYADLSDFFYVWLRRSMRPLFPELFATVTVPKADELVATAARHGGTDAAEHFFVAGMTQAMEAISVRAHCAFPVTIYYAFKQSENHSSDGLSSTGWETFLGAVISAGFSITGTWPMRTERTGRTRDTGSNALASSIVLVCRKRSTSASTATRREFVAALRAELPQALADLQRGNIAPVDLAQAAIGPGMGVFTRYSSVLDAKGGALTVRDALALINQTLDEALAEQEGDFDADTRWALAWFEQSGFAEGEFGVADVLARAKNTSVQGLVEAGILQSSRGDVRLLKPSELSPGWDPTTDRRVSAWESVHQLIRVLESQGEAQAAELVAKLGSKAETARELCYRLYTLCERKKRAAEALSYNALVQSFPELERLAKEPARKTPAQGDMLSDNEE